MSWRGGGRRLELEGSVGAVGDGRWNLEGRRWNLEGRRWNLEGRVGDGSCRRLEGRGG